MFTANNVEVVTKLRTEHLSVEDKARHKEAGANRLTSFQSLLGMVETEEKPVDDDAGSQPGSPIRNARNRKNITAEQYFDESVNLPGDIGAAREVEKHREPLKRVCSSFVV